MKLFFPKTQHVTQRIATTVAVLCTVFLTSTGNAELGLEEEKNDQIFQKLNVDAGWKATVKNEYLENVLGIYYRTFKLQDDFNKAVLETIEKQKSDPDYRTPIAQMAVYRQMIATWPVGDHLESRVKHLYKQLSEKASRGTPSEQARATEILGEIHGWISSRPDEDRLIMSSLLDDLSDIQKTSDFAATDKSGRSMASAHALSGHAFDFKKVNFDGEQNLSSTFAKYADKIQSKAQQYAAQKNLDYEEAVAAIGIDTEARKPAATEGKTVYKPSVGRDGSFSGVDLPMGHFVQTFDDGPHITGSDRVMDIALAYRDSFNPSGVPLTFFWQVVNTLPHPDKVARAKSLNILMNDHSWNHPMNYGKLTGDALKKQISDADVVLTKAFGAQPVIGTSKIPFYRCPFGECIYHNHDHGMPEARQLIANLQEIHILWNIDSTDWASINRKNPERTAMLTINQMRAERRGVILMHDIQPMTPVAFSKVLDWVKNQNETAHAGIKYVSVKEAVDEVNKAAIAAGVK